jgi:hypothetical protein
MCLRPASTGRCALLPEAWDTWNPEEEVRYKGLSIGEKDAVKEKVYWGPKKPPCDSATGHQS